MKKNPHIVLGYIIFFQLASLFLWLTLDHSFFINDGFDHFIVSLFSYYKLKSLFFFTPDFLVENLSHYIKWHGTFVEFITALFYFILPFSQKVATFVSSTIFFSILIVFTYFLGKKLFNPKTGLFAGFIVSMYPIIGAHMRIYLADLPLTALSLASIYFLLELVAFNKRKLLCFILFATCAMLTKFNFLLFIIGPFLFVILVVAKRKPEIKWNLFIGMLIPLLFFSLLFIFKLERVFLRIFSNSWIRIFIKDIFVDENFVMSTFWTMICDGINYFFWLFYEFFNFAVSSVYMILFLIGMILLVIKEDLYKKVFFTFTLGIPILVIGFVFYIEYDVRYVLPLLPFMALISANLINYLKWERLTKGVVSFIIIISVIQHYGCFFQKKICSKNVRYPFSEQISSFFSSSTVKRIISIREDPFYIFHFDRRDFLIFPVLNENLFRDSLSFYPEDKKEAKVDEVVDDIFKLDAITSKGQLFFLGQNRPIYKKVLYEITKERYPIKIIKAEDRNYNLRRNLKKKLFLSDYVIISSAEEDELHVDSPTEELLIKDNIRNLRKALKKEKNLFLLEKEFDLGKGNILFIYKKR